MGTGWSLSSGLATRGPVGRCDGGRLTGVSVFRKEVNRILRVCDAGFDRGDGFLRPVAPIRFAARRRG
jgi:hypothetical protein